jgi:hypothetical protein
VHLIVDILKLILQSMEHPLFFDRPEDSMSPIPYSGVNKGFLYGWVITLAIGALSFGYSVGAFS